MKSQRVFVVALAGMLVAGCGSAVIGTGSTGGGGSSAASVSTGSGVTTAPGDTTSPTASSPIAASSGSTSVKPLARFTRLTGNTSSVVLSTEFISALTALGIKPALVGTTRAIGERLMLPVTGGSMTVYRRGQVDPYVQGDIEHDGAGISLSAGGTTVELTDLDVRFGPRSTVTGEAMVNSKSVGTDIELFTLDLTALKQPKLGQTGTLTLSGTQIEFSPTLAAALNDTFQTSALRSGAVVGTLTDDLTGTS